MRKIVQRLLSVGKIIQRSMSTWKIVQRLMSVGKIVQRSMSRVLKQDTLSALAPVNSANKG